MASCMWRWGSQLPPLLPRSAVLGAWQQVSTHSSCTLSREHLIVDIVGRKRNVGLIQFNRPQKLNVITAAVVDEIEIALNDFSKDDAIACAIITGGKDNFSAGGDIQEMLRKDFPQVHKEDYMSRLPVVAAFRKPLIAAVNGLAIGIAVDVALMCDIIYASHDAKFGLPETRIGIIPAVGGTQRLPRIVGKSVAMEIVLTGDLLSADVALERGLVSKLFAKDEVLPAAIATAEKIASMSPIAAQMAKESVNRAYETTLAQGLHFERRTAHACLATRDRNV